MGVSPMATATGQVIASSIILLPLVLVIDRPWTLPAPGDCGAHRGGRDFDYLRLFPVFPHPRHGGATNLLLVTFLIPDQRDPAGHRLPVRGPAAAPDRSMALIGLGLSLIDGRLWRRLGVDFAPNGYRSGEIATAYGTGSTMSDDYTPPKVWTWEAPNGGQFASINRPTAGATHDTERPVGKHPLQPYSLATPNGQKSPPSCWRSCWPQVTKARNMTPG